MDYISEAKNIQDEIAASQRYLHEHAEVGFELGATVAYITGKLKEYGYDPAVFGNNCVTATVGKKGKTILLRADMDALPITEQTGLPHASTNGNMHACGHDFHSAMLLGAAKLLKQSETELNGTVKLFFQPAEEIVRGCQNALDAGLMSDPQVDAAAALHVAGGKKGEADILLRSGVMCASCDHYRIVINGRGSHGASPHGAIDPIVTGCHLVLALQNIAAREIDTQKPVVQTICKFAGGSAVNIIPESVELLGTLRTLDDEARAKCKRRIAEITELTAKTFGATAELEWLASVPPLRNDAEMSVAAKKYLEATGEITVKESPAIQMGSEDFSLIAELVPSVNISLVCVGDENGDHPNFHGPFIVLDETRLYLGTAAMATIAASWLADNPAAES